MRTFDLYGAIPFSVSNARRIYCQGARVSRTGAKASGYVCPCCSPCIPMISAPCKQGTVYGHYGRSVKSTCDLKLVYHYLATPPVRVSCIYKNFNRRVVRAKIGPPCPTPCGKVLRKVHIYHKRRVRYVVCLTCVCAFALHPYRASYCGAFGNYIGWCRGLQSLAMCHGCVGTGIVCAQTPRKHLQTSWYDAGSCFVFR